MQICPAPDPTALYPPNPHIQLSIACQSSLETMQALEQGTLDIGLIGAEDDMSAFVFEPLTDIQDIFVTTHTYLDNLKERITQTTIFPPGRRLQRLRSCY